MIRYSLQCEAEHSFESWFANAAAFDSLAKNGLLTCPDCGSNKISKALMVPSVRPGRKAEAREAALAAAAQRPAPPASPAQHNLPEPATDPAAAGPDPRAIAEALAEMRRKVEENSEYVGGDFATEARKIHQGDAPERAIYGEAAVEEAVKLVDEGIAVLPLPFLPKRKMN